MTALATAALVILAAAGSCGPDQNPPQDGKGARVGARCHTIGARATDVNTGRVLICGQTIEDQHPIWMVLR